MLRRQPLAALFASRCTQKRAANPEPWSQAQAAFPHCRGAGSNGRTSSHVTFPFSAEPVAAGSLGHGARRGRGSGGQRCCCWTRREGTCSRVKGGGFWDSFRSFGAVGDGSGCIGVSQLAARKEAAGRVRAHNILAQHVWGIGPMSGAKPEFVCRGRSGSSMTVSLRSFAKAGPRLQVSMLSAEFLDRAAQLVAEQKRSQSPFGGTLWEVLGQA